jgi:hypothetical protein
MTDRELMHKALEALTNLTRNAELQGDKFPEGNGWHALADAGENAITALRARLAQKDEPSTEPVAYRLHKTDIYDFAG